MGHVKITILLTQSRLTVPIICQGISGRRAPFFHLSPFFCLCVPPFLVPLSIFFTQKFCLHESLFLDKNLNQSRFLDKISNQIDSLILYLIIFILCNCSSFGWVAVAVAVPIICQGISGRRCNFFQFSNLLLNC